MSNIKLSRIRLTAKTEYIKWICNPRIILLAVVVVFLHNFIIQPLQEHAGKMGEPLNSLEPFIATVNSEILVIIVPAVFLALFSDFPKMDGSTLFFVHRIGKINWILGQILFVAYGIMTYVGILFLGSFLPVMTSTFWADKWSNVVTQYAQRFPDESQSFACLLIKNNIYNQVSPDMAVIHGYLLMILYLAVLASIMLLFQCLDKKIYGMLCAASVIAFGGTTSLVGAKAMWFFPMAHASLWNHFTSYFRKPVVALWKSYLYFGSLVILLIIASLKSIKNRNFDSIQEMD
ncbi:hypothetical protein [[Clostridium] polysaccharolyticum]|uniref:ABC-2 family transporter protein n=1 Tax=[Clostridium] polysaccharolyticum TaxID=29364 RepID=A0A1I0BBI2_9FIRM|nr:hypothetical protein [[Clostridium] polysaccharolyticum]SET04171.1 hypothetical protein SAMN04487772_10756 [[Clostridium] polysaccharolyticum]